MALSTLANRCKRAGKTIAPEAQRQEAEGEMCDLSHLSCSDLFWLEDIIRLTRLVNVPADALQPVALLQRLALRLWPPKHSARMAKLLRNVEPGPPLLIACMLGELWEEDWELATWADSHRSELWQSSKARIDEHLNRLRGVTGADVGFVGREELPAELVGTEIDWLGGEAQRARGETPTLTVGFVRLAEGRGTLQGLAPKWAWDCMHQAIVWLPDRDGQPGQPPAALPSRLQVQRASAKRLLAL